MKPLGSKGGTQRIQRWSGSGGTFIGLITFLVIIGGGGLYYAHITERQAFLIERNLRLMANLSNDIEIKLKSFSTTLQYKTDEWEPHQSGRVKYGLSDSQKRNGRVEKDWVKKTIQELSFVSACDWSIHQVEKYEPGSGRLAYGGKLGDTLYECAIDLRTIMEKLPSKHAFQDIFLVDPSGKVIFQRDNSQLIFFSIDSLLKEQANNEWMGVFGVGASRQLLQDGSEEQQARGSLGRMKFPVPTHRSVSIGGTNFELFGQPVMIPKAFLGIQGPGNRASVGGIDQPWVLFGMVRGSHFRDQYLALPFTYLLLIIFLLLIFILSLPLVRLMMMDARERLSGFNLVTIVLGAVIGTAPLTFFVLDTYSYNKLKWNLNDQLRQTGETIQKTFQSEVSKVLSQLSIFDNNEKLAEDIQYVLKPGRGRTVKNGSHNTSRQKRWLARVNIPCEPVSQCPYPHFILAFWTDPEGDVRINWTKKAKAGVRGTPPIKDRLYVRHVLDERRPLYRKPSEVDQGLGGENQWEFFIEPIVSYDTGEKSVVVSMKHTNKDTSFIESPWVAAIEVELASLMQTPVLSAGTGFAVIEDRSGDVWFHSVHERSMKEENFFKEIDRDPKFEALVHARMGGYLEGDYWGSAHRFFVMPVKDLPWSIVVFQEKKTLRAINFEILLFSVTLFTFYLVLVGILCVIAWFLIRKLAPHSFEWLWPNSRYKERYLLNVAFNFSLVVGFVAFYVTHPNISDGTTFWLGLTAPIVSLVFLIMVSSLWEKNRDSLAAQIGNMPSTATIPYGWYTAMLCSLLLVCSAFPAYMVFNIAQNQEVKVWVQHHLYSFSRAMGNRTGTLEVVPYNEQVTPPTGTPVQIATDPSLKKRDNASVLPVPFCPPNKNPPHLASPKKPIGASVFILNGLYKDLTFPVQICLGQEIKDSSAGTDKSMTLKAIGEESSILETLYRRIREQTLQQGPLFERGPLIETWALTDTAWDSSMDWVPDIHSFRNSGNKKVVALQLKKYPGQELHNTQWLQLYSNVPIQSHDMFTALNWDTRWINGWLIYVILYFCVMVALPYIVVRRIFAAPFQGSRFENLGVTPVGIAENKERNLIIVAPPGSGKTRMAREHGIEDWEVFDLRETKGMSGWGSLALKKLKGSRNTIVLDHFEYQFGMPMHDHEKVTLLEGLLSEKKQIYILSTFNPLAGAPQSPDSDQEEQDQKEEERPRPVKNWSQVLRSFLLLYYQEPVDLKQLNTNGRWETVPGKGAAWKQFHDMTQTLLKEAAGNSYLASLGKWIQENKSWEKWTSEQVITQYLWLAKIHYQVIWESCSMEERLALYNVALDGFIHAEHPELGRLYLKGLVRFSPNLRLMNESFRRFVLVEGRRDHLDMWKAKEIKSLWNALRLPMFLLVGGIVIFLMITQQEFKSSLAALVSILPLLFPAMPDLSNLFSGGRKGVQAD